jgi:hypothetical protein
MNKTEFRKRLKAKARAKRKQRQAPNPPPRYDDTFWEGMAYLFRICRK